MAKRAEEVDRLLGRLLLLALVVIVVSAVIGSAASLRIDVPHVTAFVYPVTIEIPDCTRGMGYWKNHPDVWAVEEIAIGGITYTKAQAIDILKTSPGGDATYILAHQLIAAKLNVLQGADPGAVESTIDDADTWLTTHPLGSDLSDSDRAEGIALADILDQYNDGEIGPGSCDD